MSQKGEESDQDGCGGEEKERKNKAGVDSVNMDLRERELLGEET